MTRLSIIIPVHNAKEELDRCLLSLMDQVTAEDELLLIEDSSTDGSGALCDSYAEKYGNIRAFHVKFRGPSPTRNYGLAQARGQYILFVDSDDWVSPGAVAGLLEKMPRHEMAVAGYYLESGSAVTEKRLSGVSSIQTSDVLTLYQRELLNVLWNKMFHASIIRENRVSFDESLKKGEDLLFILQYLGHMHTDIAVVDSCCYHYISKPTGINKSHKESMDDKRRRMARIMGEFAGLVADGRLLRGHMLNMYFRHIRDYSVGQSAVKKLFLVKKEARNPIVGEILQLGGGGFFRFLHWLHMDLTMLVLNKILLK